MSRSLQFDIVANDKASAKMKEVQGAAGQFAKSLTGMFSGIITVQNVLSQAMNKIQEGFNWGASLKDSAAAVGLTVTEFQQLEYAAKSAGIPVEKMQKAFRDLRVVMRDAQQGNEKAINIMKVLGYTNDQIAKGTVSLSDIFLKVSEAISAAKTEQEKFNIASLFFSERYAQDLIPILTNFRELKKLINETPLLSERDAKLLDRMDDLMKRGETRGKVITARGIVTGVEKGPSMLPIGGGLGTLISGAINAFLYGEQGGANKDNKGPTPGAGKIAGELGGMGGKASVQAGLAAASNVSSMAMIGGAAGFRAGAKTPEQSTLEKIEQNTRPAQEIPANGSTDFSKGGGPDSSYNALIARIRATPRRRDSAPR